MNILLDFLPFQFSKGISGAASFNKAVCDEIILRRTDSDRLFAIYDATQPKGGMYDYEEFARQHDIRLLNIATTAISHYVTTYDIDTFFIAIGQLYQKYPLEGINCRVVMGIHDIWDVERDDNLVELTISDK